MLSLRSKAEAGHEAIYVPREAIPYILLQRPETGRLGALLDNTRVGHLACQFHQEVAALKRFYVWYSTKLEARLRSKAISLTYSKAMKRELQTIWPYLPRCLGRVLSIGAGVGGLEAHLSSRLSKLCFARPEILLLDKTSVSDVFYGYHESGSAYNSLAVAGTLLASNGHPSDKLKLLDAEQPPTALPPLDLALSIAAWGFHFPVSSYLALVFRSLRPGGIVILDVRKATTGREVLTDTFGNCTTILDERKFDRVMCER